MESQFTLNLISQLEDMANGRLIVLEGIDGAGKTTQVKNLLAYLNDHDIATTSHREPGGTALGEAVREILLGYNHQKTELGKEAEFLLFASARAELIRSVVRPELEGGKTVIFDRFSASSVAYQGYGNGIDLALIDQVNNLVIGDISPDKVFLLDLNPTDALKRLANPTDRFEKRGAQYFISVRKGYDYYADTHKEIVSIINGMLSEDAVFEQIRVEIDRLFKIS